MKENYLKKEIYDLIKKDSDIFDFIQSGSLDGMWYWDLENPENEWMNAKFWYTFGYEPREKKHLASEWQDMIFKEDLAVALDNFKKHCEDPNYAYDQIVRYRHKNGSIVWVRCRGVAIRNENGKPVRMLGAHTDITKIKELHLELEEKNRSLRNKQQKIEELNEQLSELVSRDYLTGLYNRYLIDELISYQKKKADRNKTTFSICMIDINNFKKINDTYGHLAGDQVLIDFTNRLKSMLRNQDIKSRWGGDEFLVMLPENSYDDTLVVIKKIYDEMTGGAIVYSNQTIQYNVTIGIAEYKKGEEISSCINRADKDLYAKKALLKKKNYI